MPGAVELIYKSLATAGLTHDEGPDVGGPCGPYVQSERRDLYLPYAKQLVESGHAYYCFCTKERLDEARAEAERRGETFKYDKHCLHLSKEEIQRRLDAGEQYVIRQNVPTEGKAGFDDVIYGHVEVDCDTLDDSVLIKADGLPTYNFANVRRRPPDGHHARHARQRIPLQRAEVQPAVRGVRLGAAEVRPSDAGHGQRPAQAVQAQGRSLV